MRLFSSMSVSMQIFWICTRYSAEKHIRHGLSYPATQNSGDGRDCWNWCWGRWIPWGGLQRLVHVLDSDKFSHQVDRSSSCHALYFPRRHGPDYMQCALLVWTAAEYGSVHRIVSLDFSCDYAMAKWSYDDMAESSSEARSEYAGDPQEPSVMSFLFGAMLYHSTAACMHLHNDSKL